jgi:hypothetical protein
VWFLLVARAATGTWRLEYRDNNKRECLGVDRGSIARERDLIFSWGIFTTFAHQAAAFLNTRLSVSQKAGHKYYARRVIEDKYIYLMEGNNSLSSLDQLLVPMS